MRGAAAPTEGLRPSPRPPRDWTLIIVLSGFVALLLAMLVVAVLLAVWISGNRPKPAATVAAGPQAEASRKLAEEDERFINSFRGQGKIDDAFWLGLKRRNVQRYRQQLREAPQVLVVRPTHFDLNKLASTGIGMHYGWLDGRLANLSIGFQDLVSYAYTPKAVCDTRLMTHTEFPQEWRQGRLTNRFDVIDTLQVRPVERLQAAIRQQLRDQFGLAWHSERRRTDALAIRVKDPAALESNISHDFARSRSIPELASDWEHYFGKPVLDETGLTNRYDRELALIPATEMVPRVKGDYSVYVGNPNRTTDLAANNDFLIQYGLELVPVSPSIDWLVMDHVKKKKTPSPEIQIVLEPESPDPAANTRK
jgi:Protein of unknown function (DUF3738)